MNQLNENTKKSMLTRVITGAVLASVSALAIVFGGWFIFVFGMFLFISAIYEINKAIPNIPLYLKVLVYIFGIAAIIVPLCADLNTLEGMFTQNKFLLDNNFIFYSFPIYIFFALTLFTASIFDKRLSYQQMASLFMLCFIVFFGFVSMIYIRYLPDNYYLNQYGNEVILNNNVRSSLLLIYIIFSACITDLGAYFAGVLFGKHKMCPRISPNKTWEGFIGGIIFSMVTSIGLAALFELPLNYNPGTTGVNGSGMLPGLIQFSDGNFWTIILISAITPFISVIGDLVFSQIKRTYDIKDYGKVFPGHGGVLDRLDSILVSFCVVSIVIYFIANSGFLLAN